MEQFHLESIEFKKKVAFYGKYRLNKNYIFLYENKDRYGRWKEYGSSLSSLNVY